jgi:alanine dehydrogenase
MIMTIGVPKEIKPQEYRVALPPSGAFGFGERTRPGTEAGHG